MHPTWNRSSTNSPRLLNRWITLSTRRKLPFTNFSLDARSSCCCSCTNSSLISVLLSTGSFAVSTPQISTLLRVIVITSQGETLMLSIPSEGHFILSNEAQGAPISAPICFHMLHDCCIYISSTVSQPAHFSRHLTSNSLTDRCTS